MKKIYTLVAAAALAIGGIMYAATGDVAFEQANFTTGPTDGPGDGTSWTRLNGGEGTTWVFWNGTKSVRIFKAGATTQNDWIISPKLDLEAGKTYEVSMVCKFNDGNSKAEHIDLHYTSVYPEISGLESTILPETALASLENVNGDTKIDDSYLSQNFTMSGKFVAGEGDNYVALHVYGEYDRGFYLMSCKVVEAEAEQQPDPVDPDPIVPDDPEDHECSAAITGPYSSSIAQAGPEFEAGWTALHYGQSPREWTPTTDNTFPGGFKAQLGYNSTYGKDDYLCSPSIHMEKGKEYVVSFCYKTQGSDDETFTLFLAESVENAEEIQNGIVVKEYNSVKNTSLTTENNVVVIPATGDYHLVFWAHSPANKYNLQIGGVSVMENVFAPAAVTNLKATPAAYPTLEVALSWTLPTVDVFGVAIPEDKAFEKLEVFRNDEPRAIAEFTEPVTEFTDSEATGLESGKHTYSVVVTYAGAASPAAKVGPTTYVGPIAAFDVPVEIPVSADIASAWVTAEGETQDASANKWAVNISTSTYTPSCIKAKVDQGKVSDAWSFSPEFKIVEPGYYEVEIFATRGDTNVPEYAQSYVTNAQSPEASVIMPVAIDWSLYPTYTSGNNARQKAVVYISEPGNYSVATRLEYDGHSPIFTNTSYTTYKWYSVYSVSIAQGQMIPSAVTDLKALAAEDESNNVTLSWTNPTLSTAGTELQPGSYYVEVYRKEGNEFTLLATLTGGESEYVDAVPSSGAFTYAVKVLATGTQAALDDDKQATVTSSWVGSRELPLPYSVMLNVDTDANASRYIWEGIDNNQDGATWGFASNDRMVCAQPVQEIEGQPGYYQYDDYLLSPIFTMAPGYYRAKFQLYGETASHTVDGKSTQEMYVNVGLAEVGFIPGRSELIGKTLVSNNATYAKEYELIFKVEESGKYQLVFAADEINYKLYNTTSNIGLARVELAYAPVLPGVAVGLKVEPAENDEPSAIISWINPVTSSIAGITPEITKAYIFRDGVQVGTVTSGLTPGEITSWEDNDVPGGRHTYSVQLFTEEGPHTEAAPSVLSDWIGGGLEPPYAVDKYVAEGWDHYSPNTTISWGSETNCWLLDVSTGARYDQSGTTDVNGYLMTPKFQLDHSQAYKVSVKGRKTQLADCGFAETGYPVEVLVGIDGTPDTWSKVCDIYVMNSSTQTDEANVFYIIADENLESVPMLLAEEGEGDVEPEVPAAPGETPETAIAVPAGGKKLAFHLGTNFDKGNFSLYDFAIDKEGNPTGIDNVEVAEGITIAADGLFFRGTATDVAIYDLTGKLMSFAPKAEGTVSFAGLEKGIYIVRLTLDGKAVALKVAL
ncbi:MAG: T9SS type A sorting domain-containing protein [Muribaculaceae bacterium]|nr:T9SS type A sorting domain-containing protein [Muribaculaceae bacterium]